MRARDYQHMAERFDNHSLAVVHDAVNLRAVAAAMGLASEAGEVANEYERHLREDKHGFFYPLDEAKVRAELGDVLWNVARLASLNGWSIEDLMDENIDKLTRRYEEAGIPLV